MKDRRSGRGSSGDAGSSGTEKAPGRVSRVQRRASRAAPRAADAPAAVSEGEAVRTEAAAGVQDAGGALPHAAAIQTAFGHHDVSTVRAHVGGAAAEASAAIGADAYATGDSVAFRSAPDLHTAAHEAAHVVQQRAGVSLPGGVGAEGDAYEVHADRVADAVVRGDSAQSLLDGGGGPGGPEVVQRRRMPRTGTPPGAPHSVHTVVRGDTLWAISRANRTPLRDVIAANPHLTNPNLIYPGDQVYVPAATPSGTGGASTTPGGGDGASTTTTPAETTTTTTTTPTGDGPTSTPGQGEIPECRDPHASLIDAVASGDFATALDLLAPPPGTCSAAPVEGLAALAAAGKSDAFFALVRASKPYSAEQRGRLADTYHSLPFDQKKQLFEARFSVSVTSRADDDGNTAEFTEQELDTIHDQASLLPAGHVEGLSTFTALRRTINAAVAGSYSNPNVDMGDQTDQAAYEGTFRHEIGHAVDARLGGTSNNFRIQTAGWKRYGGVADFVTDMGGYGDLPADLQPRLATAIQRYLGGGSTFQAPTPTFEATLQAVVMEAHPEVTACAADGSDAVSTEMARFRACYDTCEPLKSMIACQGNNNYWRYQSWNVTAGKAFFVNHWYAVPYSIKESTHQDLAGWPSQASAQKAAFSDAEWFAETYAVWYGTPEPGTSHGWAGFVRTFFEGPVAALGDPAAQQPAGGNPAVPT
jgi:LysM repeat protein